MHKSRQTITSTPWEIAQLDVDRAERGRRAWNKKKGTIRHPEAYAAAAAFNEANGISIYNRCADVKARVIRRHKGGFKSKRPITLPSIERLK